MSNNIHQNSIKRTNILRRIFKKDNKSSNNYVNKSIVLPGVIYFDSKINNIYSVARPCSLYSNDDFILNKNYENKEKQYQNLNILNLEKEKGKNKEKYKEKEKYKDKKKDKEPLCNNIGKSKKIYDNNINFYENQNMDLNINKKIKISFNKNNFNEILKYKNIKRLLEKKPPNEKPPKRTNKK